MKITIVGGSKGTGALLASAALEAQHDVMIVSRSGTGPDSVHKVVGDATDQAVAQEAVAGQDAVVITVGAAKGVRHQRAEVTRSVIAAMQQAGVRRLLVQTSLGAGDSGAQLPRSLRLLTKVALAKPLADHNEQESIVRASGRDWTVVRPSGLTDKPATGEWQALETTDPGVLRGTIPRADLAVCMLEMLQDDSTIGKAIGVSSR